jgi:hypothetical protein
MEKPGQPQKSCSICGVSYPAGEFHYGNRTDRSYCRTCSAEEKRAYARGGAAAARAYRDDKRASWKPE